MVWVGTYLLLGPTGYGHLLFSTLIYSCPLCSPCSGLTPASLTLLRPTLTLLPLHLCPICPWIHLGCMPSFISTHKAFMPFKSLLKGHPPNEVYSDHPIEYCSLPPRPLHWTVKKFLDTRRRQREGMEETWALEQNRTGVWNLEFGSCLVFLWV